MEVLFLKLIIKSNSHMSGGVNWVIKLIDSSP